MCQAPAQLSLERPGQPGRGTVLTLQMRNGLKGKSLGTMCVPCGLQPFLSPAQASSQYPAPQALDCASLLQSPMSWALPSHGTEAQNRKLGVVLLDPHPPGGGTHGQASSPIGLRVRVLLQGTLVGLHQILKNSLRPQEPCAPSGT